MDKNNSYHLLKSATEKYETFSVPAIFSPLAKETLKTVTLPDNAQILDVACGTGIMSRHLAKQLGGKGRIVGVDWSPEMIKVAKLNMPACDHDVDWIAADVTDLPLSDGEFDIAFMQQGLQFFPDKSKALQEVRRVLAPGGILILTCWNTVSPFFQAISDSLRRRVSAEAAETALSPFEFRDGDQIRSLLSDAGFSGIDISSLMLSRKVISIRDQLLASRYEQELLDKGNGAIDLVIKDVKRALFKYQVADHFIVPQEAHLIHAKTL